METTLANTIERHEEVVEQLEYALKISKNTLVSHGWIVVYPDDISRAYSFDVVPHETEKGRYRATNPTPGNAHKVNRFTKQDAHTVASNCRDGNGNSLQAIFWKDAAEEAVRRNKDLLKMLEAAALT